MQNFEDYLCERNDTIDNAAYQLIGVLTAEDPGASLEDDPATPNWDMAIIGEVVDAVKEIIIEKVGYHEVDKLPCYLGDRCDNPHCIFKSDPDYRKAPSSVMDMDIEERG